MLNLDTKSVREVSKAKLKMRLYRIGVTNRARFGLGVLRRFKLGTAR